MTLLTFLRFLNFNFLIFVMQFGNTSLMDISQNLFDVSLSLVVASELKLSSFSRIDWYCLKASDGWILIL